MTVMTGSISTVRLASGTNLRCTVAGPSISVSPSISLSAQLPKVSKGVDCRCIWRSSAVGDVTSRRIYSPGGRNVLWQSCRGSRNPRRVAMRNVMKSRHHPSEDIVESTSESCEDLRLSAPEITRTIVEVNTKATILFPGLTDEEVEKTLLWPELPYITDEHGNIYFQANNDEDFLQNLTSEANLVEVVIGLDTMELMNDLDLFSSSDINFGIGRIEDEGSDDEYEHKDDEENEEDEDEDEDEEWSSDLEEFENDFDETPGDWTKSETMRYYHPLYFANFLAEAAAAEPFDLMELPLAGLAIKGVLRPAVTEEHSIIKRHMDSLQSNNTEIDDIEKFVNDKLGNYGVINEHGGDIVVPDEEENSQAPTSGTSFYKLEMIMIQLPSADGRLVNVEVEEYAKAQPDALAHSSPKIISRLKACEENTAQALKSLCWRCKGIGVEEATLASIDTLGFNVRVCSGTQIQTLRFPFSARVASEHDAERHLRDLLFPRRRLELEMQELSDQTNVSSL